LENIAQENQIENTQETQTESQTTQPAWYYSAPTDDNEGIAGNGDTPPEWFRIDKYKSVDEQAKAYNELASRFGGFESAPNDDYQLPEGIEPDTIDNGMLDIVKGLGKEYNMSQKMFNDLVSKVNEYESVKMEDAQKQAMESLGENAQERISNIQNWLNVNAPKEVVEMVIPMATTAESIKALEFFINKSKGSRVADTQARQPERMSQSDYAEQLMAKDKYGNLKISTDSEYKKRMDELALQFQK